MATLTNKLLLALTLAAILSACDHHTIAPAPEPTLSPMAQLGKKLFYDPSLSASGVQSCASCHNPAQAFGPATDMPAQFGGPHMDQQGTRPPPSLRYLSETPGFAIGPDVDGDEPYEGRGARNPGLVASARPMVAKAANNTNGNSALVAQGGFFWDGRARSLAEQALGPLLNPVEMANPSPEALAEKIRHLPYVDDFRRVVDPHIVEDTRRLPSYAAFAIARYELEDPAFHPYNSKYDAYLAGHASLSASEARGLKLFEDPQKGNCAACHPDKPRAGGKPPVFTDYEFEALAVPRNAELSANNDLNAYDLGICGPARRDIYSQQAANCGLFKTPSLRNVGVRQVFFHNGVYHNLKDVLNFYVQRETSPEKVYPKLADGSSGKYNDLPATYWGNIDVIDAPFNRHLGDKPALNDDEIKDVIAFLNTLTDGYDK